MRQFLWALVAIIGATRAGTTPVRVPLLLSDAGLIFVDVLVNGQKARALIDSGSFKTIQISSSLARVLGLPLRDTSMSAQRYGGFRAAPKLAPISTFEVAQVDQRNVEVTVVDGDIERISQEVRTPFDVILGWGFLSQFLVRIDYPNRMIELEASAPQSPPAMQWSFEVVNKVPVVAGTVDGRAVRFLFDTGAPMCNIDPALADRLSPGSAASGLTASVMIGDGKADMRFRTKALAPLPQQGIEAVIGTNFLSDYVVTIDPRTRTISFVR